MLAAGLNFSPQAAESYSMDELVTLRFGDRVTLVSVGEGEHATTFAATVVSHHGNSVELTLDQPFDGTSRPYILVSGEGESARFIAIEESAGAGTRVPVTTLGPWQNAADRRASSRFPTYRPCRLVAGDTVVEGHMLDLSMHGFAVESGAWSAEHFVLRVESGSSLIELPCVTVGLQHTAADLVVIHARFEDLTVAEGLAVIELTESVRADFEAAQSRLVSAHPRPMRSLRAG